MDGCSMPIDVKQKHSVALTFKVHQAGDAAPATNLVTPHVKDTLCLNFIAQIE